MKKICLLSLLICSGKGYPSFRAQVQQRTFGDWVGWAVCPQRDQFSLLSEAGFQPTWVLAGVQLGTGDLKGYGASSLLVLVVNRPWKHFPTLKEGCQAGDAGDKRVCDMAAQTSPDSCSSVMQH